MQTCGIFVVHTRGDDSTASTKSFSVYMGVVIADTGLCERPKQTARCGTRRSAGKRGHKPACGDYRTNTWYGHKTKAGQRPYCAASGSTKPRAGSRSLCTVVFAVGSRLVFMNEAHWKHIGGRPRPADYIVAKAMEKICEAGTPREHS